MIEQQQTEELLERGPPHRASHDQKLCFILTDRKYFRHSSYAAAQKEKNYLSKTNPDKTFKCLKVLNIPGREAGMYEAAPELVHALLDMIAAAEGLRTWAAGPEAWDKANAVYMAAKHKADTALAKATTRIQDIGESRP